MNKNKVRPYKVRQSDELGKVVTEWDMRRDPLSPEQLTELFTNGCTETLSVGFGCEEWIQLGTSVDELRKGQGNPDYKEVFEMMKDRENKAYQIKRLEDKISEYQYRLKDYRQRNVEFRGRNQTLKLALDKIKSILKDSAL